MSEPTGTQYGGFWVRLIALLADSAIVFLLSAVIIAGAAMAVGPDVLVPIVLVVTVAGAFYWPVMHASRRQATFGKSIVGLKVTRFDGRRIGLLRSLWREIAKFFSSAVLMLGYILAAFTPRKQALHDLMSATYVVREGPARVDFGARRDGRRLCFADGRGPDDRRRRGALKHHRHGARRDFGAAAREASNAAR